MPSHYYVRPSTLEDLVREDSTEEDIEHFESMTSSSLLWSVWELDGDTLVSSDADGVGGPHGWYEDTPQGAVSVATGAELKYLRTIVELPGGESKYIITFD